MMNWRCGKTFFHRLIVAYLMFIFALVSFGCGYKAPPFYKQESEQTKSVDTDFEQDSENKPKKKVLFREINSAPTPSYEDDEE